MTNADAASRVIVATPESVADLHGLPQSARLIFRFLTRLKHGLLDVVLPDGRIIRFNGEAPGAHGVLVVHDFRFIGRAMAGGDVGFGEGYMAGEWESPDLAALLGVFSANLDAVGVGRGGPVTGFIHWLYHRLRPNTREGARRNIAAHYDLGNDFYSKWLDRSMTYSSARFERTGQKLEDAQRNKYRTLAQSIELRPEHHVLEIGCGWGGFAEFAARDVGAKVTCLTISPAQRDFALERIQNLQLAEKVEIKLQDYRDEQGRYDRVASIEMFEAVGVEYWGSFFSKVADVLKPGGRAGLQIISIREDLFERYLRRADFIQRYIFPGGVLPSVTRLKAEFGKAGLALKGVEHFAKDYADTLAHWATSFNGAWEDIRELGFDDRFRRMWNFYLAYCEAGFRTGRIDVGQYALARS